MRFTFTGLLVLLAFDVQAQADKARPISRVVVDGSRTDVETGRDFVAGAIVVGKERIAASGLQNTGELLRREPAISIGKNGSLGLLGMNGHTQILVDGQSYPGDPLALDLIHVERIEIVKTGTAATGPYGIAGTINIIRKGVQRQALSMVRTGASLADGRVGADIAWSSNQAASATPFAYNLSLSARRRPAGGDGHFLETQTIPGQAVHTLVEGESSTDRVIHMLTATTEFSWTPAAGHKLSLNPDAGRIVETGESQETRMRLDGQDLAVQQAQRSPLTTVGLPARWSWQFGAGSSLSLEVRLVRTSLETAAVASERWSALPRRLRSNSLESEMRGRFLHLDFNTTLNDKHEIAAGAKLTRNARNTSHVDLIDGRQDASLAALGRTSATRVLRKQVFIQDDWRIDRSLALKLGVSAERQNIGLWEGPLRERRRFTLWSPSGHVARKIGGDGKRQIRFSLARNFQAPEIDMLLLRPRINAFAACPNDAPCGPNGIENADSSGNPQLQPERARSINFSYSHGIGKASELRAEWYARDIRNKTGTDLTLESVPWAVARRWVYRPANLGQARVRGIEFEGRLSGKDIAAHWPGLELRGSVGWADSALSGLPGPDNRLAGQTPWRVKLGGSHGLKALPLKLGVDANYLPGDWVRTSVSERVYESQRFTLGANASWQLDAKSKLTLNLDNLLHRTTSRISEYRGPAGLLRQLTRNSDAARMSLRLETSL
ncbi:TonB-dependent receptor plug domain-containing protein [Massilia sp.]|uniref:TonB-dependent receptor plug domain-containing protein n=1 Tax=Massilia sp. TaxID=1882437 RepID=UPI00391DA5B5